MKKIFQILIFLLLMLSPCLSAEESAYKGSVVKVRGKIGKQILSVNGKPFFIKGVGCAVTKDEKNIDRYFKFAKKLGANSIRRWGIERDTKLILDKAKENDLMVNQGIWVTCGHGFCNSKSNRDSQKIMIIDAVKRYKDHPALLVWNIGNECLKTMKNKQNKIIFCKFLEDICQEIHKIDPNHPVVYTGVVGQPLKLLKKYSPSLDIYGANCYAGIKNFRSEWKSDACTIPYIFSEFGPDGTWEVKKDKYGEPIESSDEKKAKQFKNRWNKYVRRFKGDCLGGYAFLLEEKTEESKTWWGLTYQWLKRKNYWTIYELFTGKKAKNYPPIIDSFTISPKQARGGKYVKLKIIARDPENDELTYIIDAPTKGGAYWIPKKEKNKFDYQVSTIPGVYRIYAIVKDGKGNITTASKTIKAK